LYVARNAHVSEQIGVSRRCASEVMVEAILASVCGVTLSEYPLLLATDVRESRTRGPRGSDCVKARSRRDHASMISLLLLANMASMSCSLFFVTLSISSLSLVTSSSVSLLSALP
jgi:hypothetical protein